MRLRRRSPLYDPFRGDEVQVEIRLKEDHVGDYSIMHSVSLLHPLLKDAMREAASAQHASDVATGIPHMATSSWGYEPSPRRLVAHASGGGRGRGFFDTKQSSIFARLMGWSEAFSNFERPSRQSSTLPWRTTAVSTRTLDDCCPCQSGPGTSPGWRARSRSCAPRLIIVYR